MLSAVRRADARQTATRSDHATSTRRHDDAPSLGSRPTFSSSAANSDASMEPVPSVSNSANIVRRDSSSSSVIGAACAHTPADAHPLLRRGGRLRDGRGTAADARRHTRRRGSYRRGRRRHRATAAGTQRRRTAIVCSLRRSSLTNDSRLGCAGSHSARCPACLCAVGGDFEYFCEAPSSDAPQRWQSQAHVAWQRW